VARRFAGQKKQAAGSDPGDLIVPEFTGIWSRMA